MSKLYAALLLSVCVALALLAYQNHSLQGQVQQQSKDNQALKDEVSSAKQAVTSQAKVLDIYRERSGYNAELAATQQQTITAINHQLDSRWQQMKQLERENEKLRMWAVTALPEPVMRMRQRPAIIGAAAYRDWLSSSNAVPAISEPSG